MEDAPLPKLRKKPDVGTLDGNLHLKAYEEQVLKIKQPVRQQQGQGGDGEQRSQAAGYSPLAIGDGGPTAVQGNTAGDSSDEELMPTINSLARSSDAIPTSSQWECLRGSSNWTAGKEFGTFDSYMKSLTAVYRGGPQCIDLDVTANLMIVRGNKAGLVVRGPDRKARTGTLAASGHLIVYVCWPEAGDSSSSKGSLTVSICRGDDCAEEEIKTAQLDDAGRESWHTLRVRAYQDMITCFFDRKLICHAVDKSSRTACIGVWAADSCVRIRGVSLASLEELKKTVADSEETFKESLREKELEARNYRVQQFMRIRATKLIQGMVKRKIAERKARMAAYIESMEDGVGDEMDKEMLLGWGRDAKQKSKPEDSNILEKWSPRESLAPRKEDPRDAELHLMYEMKRNQYASQWEAAGQQVLGIEQFKEMIKTHGPAQEKKKLIAKAFLKQAKEAASEVEHKLLLHKAKRLKDDYSENMEDLAKIMSKPKS
eukprot:TRINITY_DN90346_c0_g1_i1.p1 TRINITY_DN90346_c0_g1~~TRINITY_DN90346_c0_g1_i1.p1  ORF type:complete len:563 (+),score=123.14 TRINITY_DN90346_c0_g1_i1:230-1690(+)